jgi:hypothetical protein
MNSREESSAAQQPSDEYQHARNAGHSRHAATPAR